MFFWAWLHEANRVWGDRLVSASDLAELQTIFDKAGAKHLYSLAPKDELECDIF